jgi:hypothetical protein
MKKILVLSLLVFGFLLPFSNINAADCNKTSDPSVTILTPNGEEKYQAGQQVKVQWSTCNVYVDTVAKINLLPITYQGNVIPVPTLNMFSYNTGSIIFTLPSQSTFPPLIYGNYYKFHIDFPSLALDGDDSDNFFSINTVGSVISSIDPYPVPLPPVPVNSEGCNSTTMFSATTGQKCPPTPTPLPPAVSDNGCTSISIYSPKTGEKCPPMPMPPMPPVTYDDGCTSISLYNKTTGQKCITPLPPVSAKCDNNTPSVTLLAPNGGEVYQAGEQMGIKWQPCNTPTGSLARILLVRNLPNNYQDISVILETTNKYDINTDYYVWNIPKTITPAINYFISFVCGNPDGSNCSTGSGNNTYAITDDSDAKFTINGDNVDLPKDCSLYTKYSGLTGQLCTPDDIKDNPPMPLPPVPTDDCSLYTKYNPKTGLLCSNYNNDVYPVPLPPVKSEIFTGLNPSDTAIFTRFLKLGLKGTDVEEIQKRLKNKGIYLGPINGEFDAVTQEGVRKFQTENKLTVDGVVGPETLKALSK